MAALKSIPKVTLAYGAFCRLLFGVADKIYYPHLAYVFFSYRIANIVAVIILQFYISSARTLWQTQIRCTLLVMAWTLPLQAMLYQTRDLSSPYYAGLIFVIAAMAGGYRFTRPFYYLNIGLVLVPVLFIFPWQIGLRPNSYFWLSAFFLVGLTVIETFSRDFNNKLYELEHDTRARLEHEIANRDAIIEQKSASLVKIAVADAILRQNQQVSHDIRSPLTALGVLSQVSNLPDQERTMMKAVIHRINDIANKLASKPTIDLEPENIGGPEQVSPQVLATLLEPLISEKRLQFRSRLELAIELDLTQGYSLTSIVEPVEFRRAISNLINNAAEAIEAAGKISVALTQTLDFKNQITISDTGKGIPVDVISRLGARGATFNKEGGKGLGLFHAKTSVERIGGALILSSAPDKGTSVTIELPKAIPPSWFCEGIQLKPQRAVAVLDDDPSIHLLWTRRLSSEFTLQHYPTTEGLGEILKKNRPDLFLVDQELFGSDQSGLDFVFRNGLQDRTILVTSRFDDRAIQEECARANIKIVPKLLATLVPVGIA